MKSIFKMKYLSVLLLLAVLQSNTLMAQPLSAYSDFQNQFMVWDNGMIRKADYLVPQSFKIGRSAIPFFDNSRSFKIYYNGGVTKINDGFTNAYWVTDNLVAYLNAKVLNVFEAGEIVKLSNFCSEFYIGDSVVMYYDKIQSEFNIYYNGQIYNLENFLSGTSPSELFKDQNLKIYTDNQDIAAGQASTVKVSDNIAAYVNYANRFKAFFQGETLELDSYQIKNFGVGRNTIAYVNMNQEFMVFHKGKHYILESYQPYDYQVGDDLIAFVSNDNNFKIFYNDSIYNLGYFQPNYTVIDNVVYYEDASGYFHVFHKGIDYSLESYMPTAITAGYNSVAYVTRGHLVKVFTDGNVYDVVNADVPFWRIDFDVIQYRFGANLNKIFYKGKTF